MILFIKKHEGSPIHLVVRLVPLLHPQVEGVQLQLEVGGEELLLDELPDDAGHLVAEHLHHGARLDLGHLEQF